MLDLIWVDNKKVMVHYCVKEGLLLAILWVDNQKEMVHYFVKEGLLLAIFCPFYCKKRVYYSLHFFLHKDYFGRFLSKIGLRNALWWPLVPFHSRIFSEVEVGWDHRCSLRRGLHVAGWEFGFGSYMGVYLRGWLGHMGELSTSPVGSGWYLLWRFLDGVGSRGASGSFQCG